MPTSRTASTWPRSIFATSPEAGSRRTISAAVSRLPVALADPAVAGLDGHGLVSLLDPGLGPEERLDQLLGRDAGAGGGELGADFSPLAGDLVAAQAGEPGRGEDLGTPAGVAVGPGLGEQADHFAGGGRDGGPRLRPRAGGLAVELGDEPVEAVEVVAEPGLGVVVGVAEDADRSRVARVA